jgi:hypothetical protein
VTRCGRAVQPVARKRLRDDPVLGFELFLVAKFVRPLPMTLSLWSEGSDSLCDHCHMPAGEQAGTVVMKNVAEQVTRSFSPRLNHNHNSEILNACGLEQDGAPVKIQELFLTAGEPAHIDSLLVSMPIRWREGRWIRSSLGGDEV